MKIIKYCVIGLIKGYQFFISPLLPNACRFKPTCSEYAIESVKNWGVIKGLYLTTKRLLSCHPFGRHGYDPVPINLKKIKK